MVAVLQPKSVVIERSADGLADQHQHEDIEKYGEVIVLRGAALGRDRGELRSSR